MKNSKLKVTLVLGAAVGVAYGIYSLVKNITPAEVVDATYAGAEVYNPDDFENSGD